MRVNVVRNAWKIDHPDNALMRSFQDSSLWESCKLEGDEAVKRLIREGVEYTSAVCVLIGTDTWVRRWVRYEIARAIIDGRGLLSVHLNSIRHHHTKTPHTRGHNPLGCMAARCRRIFGHRLATICLRPYRARMVSAVGNGNGIATVTTPRR